MPLRRSVIARALDSNRITVRASSLRTENRSALLHRRSAVESVGISRIVLRHNVIPLARAPVGWPDGMQDSQLPCDACDYSLTWRLTRSATNRESHVPFTAGC